MEIHQIPTFCVIQRLSLMFLVAESLGADYLATGHYCRVNSETKNENNI